MWFTNNPCNIMMNGDLKTHNQQTVDEDDSNVLQTIFLRDKFKDLQNSLESDLGETLAKHLHIWRDTHLPAGPGLLPSATTTVTSTSSLTAALTRSLSFNGGKKRKNELPSRTFIARPSLLTELLTVVHIESLYNIFVAILVILFLDKALEEVVQTGSINLDLSLTYWAFGGLDRVLVIWVGMFTSSSVLVYLAFHLWAHNRQKLPALYDAIGCVTFLIYLCLFFYFPVSSLLSNDLPPASSFIVLCEQVRLFMKTWAFVRSNLTRAIQYKKDDDKKPTTSSSLCPDYSQYLYFLFIPTLIYRDSYPRNDSCNWRKVVNDLVHVIGCIFYTHFLFARFCVPIFQQFGHVEFTGTNLMVAVFSCCFPGSLVLLCGFFALLHAWMNAFAEMLRFSDRMFYKDWWNSTSYARFYRTWNCVVHDWLYEYVYKEIAEWQIKKGNSCSGPILKCLPMLTVFCISSIVHEYILALAFRFFYPVLLVMFGGFGVLFMFLNTKERHFNIFLWVTLILGTGILMCLYSMEWYARINCPPVYEGFVDLLIPRSWYCHLQWNK